MFFTNSEKNRYLQTKRRDLECYLNLYGFKRMNKYLGKYPNCGYEIKSEVDQKLIVACPMHGDFEVSKTNFYYHRGCMKCRGVHPRAYPIGSEANWAAHPVFVNDLGADTIEASFDRKGNVLYAISYSDKRVADFVAKMASRLFYSRDLELGRFFMDSAFDVKIPVAAKRDRYLRFVERWPGYKLLKIGEKSDEVVRVVPMSNGIISRIVHHVISKTTDMERIERILFHASEIR